MSDDLHHPIDLELAQLPITASAEQRLAVLWRHYSAATDVQLTDPPTLEERGEVYEWLKGLRVGVAGDSAPIFMVKQHRMRLLAALSPAEKPGPLVQLDCGSCEVVADANGHAARMFPIEVDPWSAQVDGARNRRLKDAVTTMLKTHYRGEPTATFPMCVSVVSLVPQSHRRKDADNLLKGLLDSLASVAYENDAQIQCLTSRRVEYAGQTGLYFVKLRAVRAWGTTRYGMTPLDQESRGANQS